MVVISSKTLTMWKSKCPLNDEQIKKMQYIYAKEHNQATKNVDILTYATIWLKFEKSY